MDTLNLDTAFQAISAFSGLPLDQTRAAVCLILAYPLGILFSFLRGSTLRYTVAMILGMIFQLIVYRAEALHTIILGTIIYYLAKFYKIRCVKPITIVVFIYTSCYHIYRMYDDWGGWKIDMSFALMMGLSKYTSFAWCYRDGAMPASSLSEDQNYRKIERMPSLLEFFSYMLFFPSAIVGPFFDFKDYQLFITKEGRYAKSPRGYKIGLLMLTFGILCAIGNELFLPYLNVNFMLTSEFARESILYRIGYVWLAGYVIRFKFYTGFYLTQAAVDSSGLSYSGSQNGKHGWDAVQTCGRYSEIFQNAKQALEHWNSSVQIWLKRYVYNRMIDADVSKGKKADIQKATWSKISLIFVKSKLATFAVSAFWHGFYPSYYTTFFIMWCQLEFGRAFFRAKDSLKLNKYLFTAIDYVISIIGFGYAITNHVLLDWNKSLILYQNTWFIPVLLPLILSKLLKNKGIKTFSDLKIKGVSRKKVHTDDQSHQMESKKIQ